MKECGTKTVWNRKKNIRNKMVRKIAHDWSQKKLYFSLKQKLEWEKMYRDTFMKWTTRAVTRCDEPISHHLSITESRMFQQKSACYLYNQYGISTANVRRLKWTDYVAGHSGNPGTGDYVSSVGLTSTTFYQMIRKGHVLVHRVNSRGAGTDKHMQKGGYEYRWKKVLDRDYAHYTRA
eukprot:PhF_6_TR23880/c0_g1_i1/m.33457